MDAYNEYLNLFDSFNFGSIITISIIIMGIMGIFSIIKYIVFIKIIKRSVKKAIIELESEREKERVKKTNINN